MLLSCIEFRANLWNQRIVSVEGTSYRIGVSARVPSSKAPRWSFLSRWPLDSVLPLAPFCPSIPLQCSLTYSQTASWWFQLSHLQRINEAPSRANSLSQSLMHSWSSSFEEVDALPQASSWSEWSVPRIAEAFNFERIQLRWLESHPHQLEWTSLKSSWREDDLRHHSLTDSLQSTDDSYQKLFLAWSRQFWAVRKLTGYYWRYQSPHHYFHRHLMMLFLARYCSHLHQMPHLWNLSNSSWPAWHQRRNLVLVELRTLAW